MKKVVRTNVVVTPSVKEVKVKLEEKSEYVKEAVFNPFTNERFIIKLKDTGVQKDKLVAQGWFPIDDQFTVLMEMTKAKGAPEWTVIGFPLKPIK